MSHVQVYDWQIWTLVGGAAMEKESLTPVYIYIYIYTHTFSESVPADVGQ